jgi:hypothetical protein
MNVASEEHPIDFVVTWLDPADHEWQQSYRKHARDPKYDDLADLRLERYRDWNNLAYWFRGVELHAPWVRTIHFVTRGHLPAWLDLKHPKLNVVFHDEYIDTAALPTFNSNAIELSLSNLEALSERFVLFNDDIFLLKDVTAEYFFREGLPCDFAIMNAWDGRGLSPTIMNNLRLLNSKFSKRDVLSQNPMKWFTPVYGVELARTLLLLPWPGITGFVEPHLPISYFKTTFKRCWEMFEPAMMRTCRSRFRLSSDINHFLCRYLQLAEGTFHPVRPSSRGKYFSITDENVQEVVRFLQCRNAPVVALNDGPLDDFERARIAINDTLAALYPNPSSFELRREDRYKGAGAQTSD